MSKQNFFFVSIAVVLISAGAYVVYKIPSPSSETLSQNELSSVNINESEGDTLGVVTTAAPIASVSGSEQMNDKLLIEDILVGTGEVATSGKKVTVNYSGTLTNGQKFDSSYDRNEPFSFTLGVGEVIPGWDQGVAGMKVGGKRKLSIPPSLGYGARDLGSIPPNSTLLFEVELLKVE